MALDSAITLTGANPPAEAAAKVETPANESLAQHLEKTVEGFKTGEGDFEPEETEAKVAPKIDEDGKPIEPTAEKDEVSDKEKEKEPGEEDKKEETGEDVEKKTEEPEEGKPVPYDRFKEVVEAKSSFQRQLEEAKPLVENFTRITNYCQQNNITPDQFQKAMEVQALLNTNPEEALKRILPIVESLQGYTGNKLPEDLQKKVDDGKMELADAREFAKLRAQLQFGEAKVRKTEAQMQQEATVRFQNECAKEAMAWDTAKRKSDPDYAPKKNDSEVDGKWEDVRDKYQALITQTDARGQFVNPVNTPAKMVELMERAYKAVDAKYQKINGKKLPTKKPLMSNGSRGSVDATTIESASSMKEAIGIALAQRAK